MPSTALQPGDFTERRPRRASVRFAPSPTGLFHVGNLRTAWISRRFAWELDLDWVVRFEDIDRPRVVAGAMEQQTADLRELGLVADRVVLQSERAARHEALFRAAVEQGQVYPCTCSRREIAQDLARLASAPHGEQPLYNGRCRRTPARSGSASAARAWRFRNAADPAGTLDFIVGRTDGLGSGFAPSYHWACAIDDYDGAHVLLVRAVDLAQALPLQRAIHGWVAALEGTRRPCPAVFHTALVTDDRGHRLEKRTRGVTLGELAAAGVRAAEVAGRFHASFDPAFLHPFAPGDVWGEAPAAIRLLELGLAVPSR